MIKLIAKTNRAKNKINHHGEFAEIIKTDHFKGEPAILVKHVDTGHLRWVLLNLKDAEFRVN